MRRVFSSIDLKRVLAFFAFLIQLIALYLQVDAIVSQKKILYAILFGAMGVISFVLGVVIAKRKKEKITIAIAAIIEGLVLFFTPIAAVYYVNKIDTWLAYAERGSQEEHLENLSTEDKYVRACELTQPGRQEYRKAFIMARSAADAGYPLAFDLLGLFYANGVGCKKDLEKAAFNFAESTRLGVVTLPMRLQEYPEIRNSDNKNVRAIIDVCERNIALINNVLSQVRAHNKEGESAMERILGDNRDSLELLSEKGYTQATGMLYVWSMIRNDSTLFAKYSHRLIDSHIIPDMPKQRYVFYRRVERGLPELRDNYGLSELNRLIENKDFFLTLWGTDSCSYDCMMDDITVLDKYRYTLAQLKRCGNLIRNRDYIVAFFAPKEDLEAYYKFAKQSHQASIEHVEAEIAEKYGPVF